MLGNCPAGRRPDRPRQAWMRHTRGMDGTPGLDLALLRAYLDRVCPDLLPGRLDAEVIAGGRSNLTYRVRGATRDIVLRRPPVGHVLPSAHDMARGVGVSAALHRR